MAITRATILSEPGQPPRFGNRRAGRIGLLGGSFNPAHAGHRQIAEAFRTRLRLHQVWLMVSPGNPLKPRAGMAPLAQRLRSARGIADPPRVVATDIEATLGRHFTVDTVRDLRRRFPHVRFVWLMGADVWAELPRWRQWRRFTATIPMAVHARPGARFAPLTAVAGHRLRHHRLPAGATHRLAGGAAPGWVFLALPPIDISATALRKAGLGLQTATIPPAPPPDRSRS